MKKNSIMHIILETMKAFLMTVMVMFIVWIFISWLNVGFNNQSPETIQNIWSWNFFTVMSNF